MLTERWARLCWHICLGASARPEAVCKKWLSCCTLKLLEPHWRQLEQNTKSTDGIYEVTEAQACAIPTRSATCTIRYSQASNSCFKFQQQWRHVGNVYLEICRSSRAADHNPRPSKPVLRSWAPMICFELSLNPLPRPAHSRPQT